MLTCAIKLFRGEEQEGHALTVEEVRVMHVGQLTPIGVRKGAT